LDFKIPKAVEEAGDYLPGDPDIEDGESVVEGGAGGDDRVGED
jgi:hypothetical protein